MEYNPNEFEKKWRSFWEENEIYKVTNDFSKPKYYVLDMFPYPSGSGLHVGHPLGYVASDIFSRRKRMQGFNVLHPMGYDAFGLPAEQYAITIGVHPAKSTNDNIKKYRNQLDNLAFSYDWSRQVNTSDPAYYKWTQWIFIQLYNHYYDQAADKAMPIENLKAIFEKEGSKGAKAANSLDEDFTAAEWNAMSEKDQMSVLMNYRLVYRKAGMVNWCQELGTVLANDEVVNGVSERGGYPVTKKTILQWSLRTTAYAERLLNGLDNVDWSDALKTQQRNWIGRSEGASVFFKIKDHEANIEVFTTRPDTIFGATYMVLAPEHDLISKITTAAQKEEIAAYLAYVKSRSDVDRMSEVKKVTGAFTGAYAINPITNTAIPIWTAEYVLAGYGTGAIMAVPSDDDRDKAFAEHFNLPIIDVVDKTDYPGATLSDKVGKMINSDYLNGMEVKEAIEKMNSIIEEKGLGKCKINYKLRDANYSRQRYWGEPIPITYDEEGKDQPLAWNDLPLELPEMADYKPGNSTDSPLARNTEWVNSFAQGQLETDTMPGFAGSSWYFLRYMDPDNPNEFASEEALKYWESVDLYIGGAEHAVGHLMYSRMWHKFLFDIGKVPTDEPFKKLVNQGMIQGVIEYLYMKTEKTNGYSHFLCAGLAKKMEIPSDQIAQIPIHVDMVQDYGSAQSYLNIESIQKFIEWRPEYKDAIFECPNGTFHKGNFTPQNGATDSSLRTESVVGKMSKRYFNVINPDRVIEQYGSDCLRMYEMFLGPLEAAKPWDTQGIEGVYKFLKRFWSLFYTNEKFTVSDEEPTKAEYKVLHTAIKKVNTDVDRLAFNTGVSAFMVCTNDLKKMKCNKRAILAPLLTLLSPFAPHIADELWNQLGHSTSIALEAYPEFDPTYLVEDSITYPVSINGKKRATIDCAPDLPKEEIEKMALEVEQIQKWLEGKTVRKIIVVPKRMVNIVVG